MTHGALLLLTLLAAISAFSQQPQPKQSGAGKGTQQTAEKTTTTEVPDLRFSGVDPAYIHEDTARPLVIHPIVRGTSDCNDDGKLGVTSPGVAVSFAAKTAGATEKETGKPGSATESKEQHAVNVPRPAGSARSTQETPSENQAVTSKKGEAASVSYETDLHFKNGRAGPTEVVLNFDKDAPPRDYKFSLTASGCKSDGSTSFSVSVGSQFFNAVVGVGTVLRGTQETSYKVINNDTLSTTSIGHKSPDFLLGARFRLDIRKRPNWLLGEHQPWSAFISIKFSTGGENTVNGFVFGGGYAINRYLDLVAGYSLSPNDEISPGFRIAAAQVVTANQNIPLYQRFNANDMLNNKEGAFDGFPLFVQSAAGPTTQKVFTADVTSTHYRGAGFFGVTFPLELQKLFGGGKTK